MSVFWLKAEKGSALHAVLNPDADEHIDDFVQIFMRSCVVDVM